MIRLRTINTVAAAITAVQSSFTIRCIGFADRLLSRGGQISEHKARASANFRRETKVFENGIQLNNLNYLITLDE